MQGSPTSFMYVRSGSQICRWHLAWCRIIKNQTWREWFAIVTKTLYFKLVRLKVGYVELG